MPFQVTFSQKAIPAGVIQSIDAGRDGNAVCDVNFTLTATVVGDLTGHTVEWIQLTGSPVTFTTPTTQLSVTYSQSVFDDKSFRFYVDRGTAFELFDDVNIFGSPATPHYSATKSPSNYIVVNSSTSTEGDNVNLRLLTPAPTTRHSGVAANKTYTTAILAWQPPETDQTVLGFIVRERNSVTGIWNDIATLLPDATTFDSITLGNSYQIATILQYANSHIGQNGSNVVYMSGNIRGDGVVVVETPSFYYSVSADAIGINDYAVEQLSIITHPIDNDSVGRVIGSSGRMLLTNYDTEQVTLVTMDSPDDSVTGTARSATARSVTVTDYDVTVLTGGQIGGN